MSERTNIQAQIDAARAYESLMVPSPEDQIAGILREAEQVLRPYVTRDGTVVFTTSAHIISGHKNRGAAETAIS
jgi:hypothetical protein